MRTSCSEGGRVPPVHRNRRTRGRGSDIRMQRLRLAWVVRINQLAWVVRINQLAWVVRINHEEAHPMSRESDWHVFDKACDITAMAAKGSAATATPAQVADIFRAVHAAL